jgi:hypothetical protein
MRVIVVYLIRMDENREKVTGKCHAERGALGVESPRDVRVYYSGHPS